MKQSVLKSMLYAIIKVNSKHLHASAGISLTRVTSVQKALTTEFKKWTARGYCPSQHLEELAEL